MPKDEGWVRFFGNVVREDETGIILEATDGSDVILKHRRGDYRRDKDGSVEIRIGSYAEFLRYPKGCDLKNSSKE